MSFSKNTAGLSAHTPNCIWDIRIDVVGIEIASSHRRQPIAHRTMSACVDKQSATNSRPTPSAVRRFEETTEQRDRDSSGDEAVERRR
jgi:hypothetical protein